MAVYYEFTNEGLKQLLTDLLAQPDFLTVSRRDIVSSFLCSHLRRFGYVAVTHEEIILRSHYDYRGSTNGPVVRAVDMFQHADLFVQLGISSPHHGIARKMVEEVVGKMVHRGILVLGKSSDGQMDFVTTQLANPLLSIDQAVWELRKKLD